MTTALALEYIPRRMQELGIGSSYYLRFRHLVLLPGSITELNAYNQFYILLDEAPGLQIESDMGYYDLAENLSNEQSYEHQGLIRIRNYAATQNTVRFIQVIVQAPVLRKNGG